MCILERFSDCGMEAREVVGNSARKDCKQEVIGIWSKRAIVDIDLGGLELFGGLYQKVWAVRRTENL